MPLSKSTKNLNKKRHKTKRIKKKRTKTAQKPHKAPQIGSQAFIKLRNKWYAKLAEEGFKDLESFKGGQLEPHKLLNGPSLVNAATQYKPEKLHYYRLWSCFIAFNEPNLNKRERLIAKLYADGKTYREIISALKAAGLRAVSLQPLHTLIKRLEERVKLWNKRSPHGLNYTSDLD